MMPIFKKKHQKLFVIFFNFNVCIKPAADFFLFYEQGNFAALLLLFKRGH